MLEIGFVFLGIQSYLRNKPKAEVMAWLLRRLHCKHVDLCLGPQYSRRMLSAVACACNRSTKKVDISRSLELSGQPIWLNG